MTSSSGNELNVLFLGGGKRVSLAQCFFQAGQKINRNVNIFSYELDEHQPISLVAKIIKGKRWDDPNVAAHVLGIIVKNDIDLIVTNVDPALKIHATLRENHPSARFCSGMAQIDACYSKKRFQRECEILGLPVIPSWDRKSFPLLVKPEYGSASRGVQLFNDMREFEESGLVESNSLCFQKYIQGTEFTVDAYVTQADEILAVSPRIRIETLGGESVVTKTVRDDRLVALSLNVLKKMDLRGPITLQFIREESSGIDYLMEINTRLGGGVICSIESGFDIPLVMLNEVCGYASKPIFLGKPILMKRYFSEAFYAIDN